MAPSAVACQLYRSVLSPNRPAQARTRRRGAVMHWFWSESSNRRPQISQQIRDGLVVRAFAHVSQRRTSSGGAIAIPVDNSGDPRVFGRNHTDNPKTFTWLTPSQMITVNGMICALLGYAQLFSKSVSQTDNKSAWSVQCVVPSSAF